MTQTGPAFVFGSFVFLDGGRGEKTNTEFTTLERRSGNKGAALLLPGNRLSPQEDGRVCLGTTIQVLLGVRARADAVTLGMCNWLEANLCIT